MLICRFCNSKTIKIHIRLYYMKTYEAVFDKENSQGVFAISLVHDPAMEGTFIAMNKDTEIKLTEVDKEQRILMGLVLEPNKPVYRNNNGEEFNIVFSEGTIKDVSYNFFKSDYHKNSTIEHLSTNKIEGVTFVESWIIEDPNTDKSTLHGFSYPKGSWMAVMKVDNDEVWNDYVKTGKVRGFSVDAMLSLEEVKLKSDIKMTKEMKQYFNELADSIALKLSGKTKNEIKDEAVESTEVVAVEENVNEEIIDQTQDEIVETIEFSSDEMIKKIEDVISKALVEYSKTINDKIESLEKLNKELDGKVVELSNEPATTRVVSQPTHVVELNSKGRILSKIRNK